MDNTYSHSRAPNRLVVARDVPRQVAAGTDAELLRSSVRRDSVADANGPFGAHHLLPGPPHLSVTKGVTMSSKHNIERSF